MKVGDRVGYSYGSKIYMGEIIEIKVDSPSIRARVRFDENWHPSLDNKCYTFSITDLIKYGPFKRIFSDLDPYGEENWEE